MGTPFDFIAKADAEDAKMAFIQKFVNAKLDIVSFVDKRLDWNNAGEFLDYHKGSFNLSIAVRHSKTNDRVLIRFPLPGKVYGPWLEEKVKNEVMVMKYLSQHTSIPIPQVYYWGLTQESPQQLGPFIIEEFIEGEDLKIPGRSGFFTMRITALLDFEFTNVMPAQYAYDVPWWLILGHPAIMISEGKQEFLDLFEPRKEQFIRAVERVEVTFPLPTGEPPLSARMRDSWNSGRFWLNLAARSSFDVDEIYWKCLHKDGRGEAMLDRAILAEKDDFLKRKRDQFDAYWAEKGNDQRFN